MANQNLVYVPGLLCTEALWAHQLEYLSKVTDCSVADVTGANSIDALAERVIAQSPA